VAALTLRAIQLHSSAVPMQTLCLSNVQPRNLSAPVIF